MQKPHHRYFATPEACALVMRARQGDVAARDQFLASSDWFVKVTANFFRCKYPRVGIDRGDVEQWGRIALMLAIDVWQPERGSLEKTVLHVVHQEIRERIQETGDIIPISPWVYWDRAKLRRLGHDVATITPERAAEILGRPVSMAKLLLEPFRPRCPMGDVVARSTSDAMDAKLDAEHMLANTRMSARERDTVIRIFGIGRAPETGSEIARSKGVLPQGINAAKLSGLAKLRNRALAMERAEENRQQERTVG